MDEDRPVGKSSNLSFKDTLFAWIVRAVQVGCWKERFDSFRSKTKVTRETLHCVNGDWFNSVQSPEQLGVISSCRSCRAHEQYTSTHVFLFLLCL